MDRPLPRTTASLRRRCLQGLPVWALAATGWLAQAAPLQDKADGLTMPATPAAQSGTTTLDRALQVDTAAAQPNANVLPMASDSDGTARPAARRPALPMLPSQPAAPTGAQMSSAPVEQAPRTDLLNDAGSMVGTSSPSETIGTSSPTFSGLPAEPGPGGLTMGRSEDGSLDNRDTSPALRGRIKEIVLFLRENKLWLLGAAAALAAVVAVAQGVGGRAGGSPEARARAETDARARAEANTRQRAMAAAERQARRTRRRSSRGR